MKKDTRQARLNRLTFYLFYQALESLHAGLSTATISKDTNLSTQTVRKHMHALVQEGLVTEEKPDQWKIV